MALFFSAIKSKEIKVISQKDEALDNVSVEDYQEYLKDLDESKLTFKEGETPTYFVLKTAGTQKEILSQKDGMASLAMKSKDTGEMPIYSLMLATVRTALKDMITDGESQMVKDKSGLASEEFMTWLVSNDIVGDLYTALESHRGATDQEILKKKSAQSSTSTLQIMES